MSAENKQEIHTIEQKDFHTHPFLSRLLELHDIPKQIYVRGTLPEITLDEYGRATPRILTVVGSRKHTSYGKAALEKIISPLAGHDVIVISGLAHGIDGLAHTTALKHNIRTLAVLGNGLNESVIYPSSHKHLAEEILGSGECLISELEPTTQAAQWTFPARNRIKAALSDAVLIVEAEEKSGTLITARLALELGRDIGAIPGEILSPTSAGTNALIRDGAYAITCTDDIFSLLHLSKNETEKDLEIFTEEEQSILSVLTEPTQKDTLLITSNLPLETFLSTFSTLEMKGVIEETFGEVRRIV